MNGHTLEMAKNEARAQISVLATSQQERLAMERGMVILADVLEEL